jgi:hypothetical protein
VLDRCGCSRRAPDRGGEPLAASLEEDLRQKPWLAGICARALIGSLRRGAAAARIGGAVGAAAGAAMRRRGVALRELAALHACADGGAPPARDDSAALGGEGRDEPLGAAALSLALSACGMVRPGAEADAPRELAREIGEIARLVGWQLEGGAHPASRAGAGLAALPALEKPSRRWGAYAQASLLAAQTDNSGVVAALADGWARRAAEAARAAMLALLHWLVAVVAPRRETALCCMCVLLFGGLLL